MKKIILLVCFLCLSAKIQAQTSAEKEVIKKTEDAAKMVDDTIKNGWKYKGKITFLFNAA